MANKVIKSINLLPEIFRTDKNAKFLSSTIDQLIQPPQLERIDGYIGSKLTPTYVSSTDNYIAESLPLRRNYQLEPALVIKDQLGTVNDVIGIDDLTNEIATKGGQNTNFDKMFRSEMYSFDPRIDWDKLVNYTEYYWMVNGPETIVVDTTSIGNIETNIVGKQNYTLNIGTISLYDLALPLSNGMKLRFTGTVIPSSYYEKEFIVEGVGNSIKLVSYELLLGSQSIKSSFIDSFGVNEYDDYPFDSSRNLPIVPEYITINRASRDGNPWSRYNRWVHTSIIADSAAANNRLPVYPANKRAQRPIIEFNADIKLFNFGSLGINNIDLIDNITTDAFSKVAGTAGYYVDGVLLEQGNRVIFTADIDPSVRNKIYQVDYIKINGNLTLTLKIANEITSDVTVGINSGTKYARTNWWFNNGTWQYAQQHDILNQAPLFDLFDNTGNSYSDITHHLSNFTGNKIFSYDVGTGSNDPVLGFPLKYKNSSGVGSFLFKNYFMADTIEIAQSNNSVNTISTGDTYFKFVNDGTYGNVWITSAPYQIPIIQSLTVTESTTSTIVIDVIDLPATDSLKIEVFVNNVFTSNYEFPPHLGKIYFNNPSLTIDDNVLINIYTNRTANDNGYYELPLSLTNNPLNGPITSLTLSELSDHLHTAIIKSPKFIGKYPGVSNLRDISNIAYYGNRLVSNANPLAFANFFIGKKEHSVIDALTKSADQYNQFKLSFLKKISEIDTQTDPVGSLDRALKEINADKDLLSPYYLSDMIAYGTDKTTRTWTITDSRNTVYPIVSDFSLTTLSLRSIIVYLNGEQILRDRDYKFVTNDSSIQILKSLTTGDILVVDDYYSTEGSFVPATPTKLGLFPKFIPSLFEDNTYLTPVNVIQGHDGSIMLAYNDYRDAIIIEFEKRVYNNIKAEYRPELIDVNSIIPSAFRTTDYSVTEINSILQGEFIKWSGFYGIDYTTNNSFNDANPFTWNYTGSYNAARSTYVPGYWRGVFKYFYDTDRPHTHPWEMLGFTEEPTWWSAEYGDAPYLSTNTQLWTDLSNGFNRHNNSSNPVYARPGLLSMLPVNTAGNLVTPSVRLVNNITAYNKRQGWKFGDQGPAETAWRRSSYWPFVVQKLLALTKPAVYASLMYDPSRIIKNAAGQWTYGTAGEFLNITAVNIHDDANKTQTSGYSVYISEIGQQRSTKYVDQLRQDLIYIDFNLFYKVGGFVSKDKLQIVIDAYEPNSTSPGALLPQEDYNLILNTSNPVKSASISGLVVQKINDKYAVQGYDTVNPYFNVYTPIRNSNTPTITVGGVSAPYVIWSSGSSAGATNLSAADTTTAVSATTGKFYQVGQFVSYGNNFYRVTVSHQSSSVFNVSYFQILPSLPITGGAVVQTAIKFETEVTQIPYKTEFSTIQEVYDLIIGYGEWLTDQGFIFDDYNTELNSAINWSFSAKEFLYWTTQNWANQSVITLSPFAEKIKYNFINTVVDNIFDSFYEYSLLKADGISFPQNNISVNRDNGICTIETVNSTDGIYFATIHSVQKEHAMVFNNATVFKDVIYDIETGYRQRRMKLTGFRTANWNGDYFSPGFVYDSAQITDWAQYTDYKYGDIVRFNSQYYSAIKNVVGSVKFDFILWTKLGEKPVAGLLPNFDYKINQFEDFYSSDIDNFDSAQQKMAQHLTGYTPRVYLNNIFTNPIAQYKFYQGFIKEKGTRNAITKLAKASLHNLQGRLDYSEEWAFRIGHYGSYETYQELEVPLAEGRFIENPQIIKFVDSKPIIANDLIYYSTSSDRIIVPEDYTPASTFSVETDIDFEFKLVTAGYVRLDDVTATAYNENSLLDIANNNNINEGDTIWIGFKPNGGWDVVRYVRSDVGVTGVFVSSPTAEITFITNINHNLSVGDIVSVSQFNTQINGVYRVTGVPLKTRFTVASTLASITNAELPEPGALFKFTSARVSNYDSFPSDTELLNLPDNTKFWINDTVDRSKAGNKYLPETWAVYEKVNNYSSIATSVSTNHEQFGYSISKRKGNDIFVIGSPAYNDGSIFGKVAVYKKIDKESQGLFSYFLNDDVTPYYDITTPATEFGSCVVYDDITFTNTNYGLIFVGAPGVSHVYNPGTTTPSSLIQQGIVKISSVDISILEASTKAVVRAPDATNFQRFGSSIYVQRNTSTKLLLVGAPGTLTTGTGTVYSFNVNATTSTVRVNYVKKITTSTVSTSSQWGYSIGGSDNAGVIAIGAPGYSDGIGLVSIFTGTNVTFLQTIISPFFTLTTRTGRFGEKVTVSGDGSYLAISAPTYVNEDLSIGAVAIYTATSGLFVLDAILSNPISGDGMKFGHDVDISTDNNTLIISAIGDNKSLHTTFDKTKSTSESTFDAKSTTFYGVIKNIGTVYVYHKRHTRYVLADDLETEVIVEGSYYGTSIAVDDDVIYVGAPAKSSNATTNAVYQFNKIDKSVFGYNVLREQDSLIMTNAIQKVTLINSFTEEVVDYLDIIDPLKGKIAGLADQELKYKSAFDPAVYSIGIAGTVNDTDTNWLHEHVGELWWDLSTVKYQWYEQSDLSYRKNNWGKLFPGATIDVYEWVGSSYLPSEWSSIADTAAGLTEGISGQPKFADNSVISVKQVYSSVTNSFSNRYYYWVKNKITVPDSTNRRTNAYQVASMIADPTVYGLKYAAILDSDSVALANVGSMLVGDRIHLNIASDSTNKNNPATSTLRHTEWLLLQEGSAISRPNALLEKKLLDSLLGHDKLGNSVPDPKLTSRTRYGIGIRPQQTLFKDRLEALRNLVEFTNNILIKNRISGNYDFINLNKQDTIPSPYTHEYDQTVEDNEGLLVINTRLFELPKLTCTIDNGRIRSVQIISSGFGYKISPTVKIVNDVESDALITTEIDSMGRVISATIVNAGSGFTVAPTLLVRQYTVIVIADTQFNGKWSKFVYDLSTDQWTRTGTQQYNTPLYWKYVDWSSTDYNPFLDYVATVDDVYQVNELTLTNGQYVKVKNGGLGNYIILEKTAIDGSFSNDYNIVYSENGTIQILDTIWNLSASTYGFDQRSTFDQTLFDQTPDIELQYILAALRDNIFVNDLKINWNLFFFKAVKYALSEQKLLDWAFKTSFITVVNYAGTLDQRPVYKISSSDYYEQYLAEVKPYHTTVRSFTANHTVIEPTQTFTSDFDLPSVYNKSTGMFEQSSQLTSYPWKAWADNYKYTIGSISISNPGSEYTSAPAVQITHADGDVGTTATAVAYIGSGEVTSIKIANPGSGYTKSPIITLVGGTLGTNGTAYANLINGKVRTNLIGMKFDRISDTNQIGDTIVVDRFICNGYTNEFVLNWVAEKDKFKIDVYVDGRVAMSSDYSIQYYTSEYNGYEKKFSKLIFLNYIPTDSQLLEVSYHKSVELFNATERILNYYTATSSMPGMDLGQLMTGIDYPKTQIEGLPFGSTLAWMQGSDLNPFDTFAYADNIGYYTKAKVAATAVMGDNIVILNTTTGITVGQHANIISTTTNGFNTSTVIVTEVHTSTRAVAFNSTLSKALNPSDTTYQIEFWTYDENSNLLDSNISGGSWTGLTRNLALGINPEDIIIDGDGFYTANTSHAPEEFVPGQASDSIGINVYTKTFHGAPVVFTHSVDILPNVTTRRKLGIVPPSNNNITVSFDGRMFSISTDIPTVLDSPFFYIDWETNEIVVGPQSVSGYLGYTIISIGGGRSDTYTEIGVIDNAITTTVDVTATVVSLADFDSVKSVYVTVNGLAITTSSTIYYKFEPVDETSHRAAVKVFNLPDGFVNTAQAWFFGTFHDYFNEISEQVIVINTSTTSTSLTHSPGNIEPVVAETIVEHYDPITQVRKQLIPPHIDYYQVTSPTNNVFLINNQGTFNHYPPDQTIRVYRNGIKITAGFDFTVSGKVVTIDTSSVRLSIGDVIAIVDLPTGADKDYEYDIVGTTLNLSLSTSTGEIKVLTYNDADDMVIRTERFDGNPNRRFKISRPVTNINYVWVQLNGTPLTSGLDFGILDDQMTIQISDANPIVSTDSIVIRSMVDQRLATAVLGYRIFNDMFNRTHFKRLSKENTTQLTRALSFTDTEIYVDDSAALTPPLISKNIPGVVIIDGERIEFMKADKNVLRQLRRGTLGTSPGLYYIAGTKVIDQSPDQTIPFAETISTQVHYTTANTSTYIINLNTQTITIPNTTDVIVSDGIALQTAPLTSLPIRTVDQVQVFYGGRLLRKDGIFVHDTTLSYDSPDTKNITIESTATVQDIPNTNIIGTSYIVTTTNQVWVYTGSVEPDAVNGYVYRGLNYLPPEFDITVILKKGPIVIRNDVTGNQPLIGSGFVIVENSYTTQIQPGWIMQTNNGNEYTVTSVGHNTMFNGWGIGFAAEITIAWPLSFYLPADQRLVLNIANGVDDRIKLTLVKKGFDRSTEWNGIALPLTDPNKTVSLMDSTTLPAKFLQERPAELPDKYYYGGDRIARSVNTLTTENGSPLLDENNNPLTSN
jgi:hypothetical protein